MVNLKDVSTPEQVYSEELNEILIKTPPRLFKVAIGIFTAFMVVGLLGGFLINYERNNHYHYVLYENEQGKTAVVIFSEEDISNQLRQNKFSLYPGSSGDSANELKVGVDSILTEKIYRVNNTYLKLEGKEVETLPEISNLEIHYKYYLYLPAASSAAGLGGYRVGMLYLPMGKRSLIRLFTGT